MRLTTLAVLAPIAVLAACSEPETPPTEPPPPASVILGGVDLNQPVRAVGNEPFWSVSITPTALNYDRAGEASQTAPNAGPAVQGTTAVFTATTSQNVPLVITLIDTDCSDGMSERPYPLTAQVKIGEETLSGCAISQAELDAMGEGGETAPETAPEAAPAT